MRHDTIQWLVRRYDAMRIRYGYDTDAMRHDTIYDVRYGYGTDTMRHDTIYDTDTMGDDTIRWFVRMMAPDRLMEFMSLANDL